MHTDMLVRIAIVPIKSDIFHHTVWILRILQGNIPTKRQCDLNACFYGPKFKFGREASG